VKVDGSLLPWLVGCCALLVLQLLIAGVLEVLRPQMAARGSALVEMHDIAAAEAAVEEDILVEGVERS
jgi:hypothetical protein